MCQNGDYNLVRSCKSVDKEYSQRGQTAKLFGINKIFLTVYIEARNNILSPSMIKGYNIIKITRLQLIKEFNIGELALNDIQRAVNYDSKGLSRKSVKSAVALLKSALDMQGFDISDFIVQYSYNYIRNHFKQLIDDNGFDITFRKLRHEFATALNDLGIPSNYIQKLGDWATDNAMKLVYTHTTASKENEYQAKINDFFAAL